MRVFTDVGHLPAELGHTAVALGYFDGMHIGHQAVIGAAAAGARQLGLVPAVFTFTQEGAGVKGQRILTAEQKHRLLAELSVQYCFEPPFESFRSLSPQAFFTGTLMGALGAKALFCGEDFGFGAGRAGTVATLAQLARGHKVSFQSVHLTSYGGQPVSASRIRAALAAGEMDAVAGMLGRRYELEAPVQGGRHLGRTLGFPTINQSFPPGVLPPAHGVYISQTLLGEELWPSVTGYGTRPTVDDGPPSCETFIPGFEGDLYGRVVRVQFFKRIDTPRKFATLGQLADAVQDWAAQALAYFER